MLIGLALLIETECFVCQSVGAACGLIHYVAGHRRVVGPGGFDLVDDNAKEEKGNDDGSHQDAHNDYGYLEGERAFEPGSGRIQKQ